MSCSPGGRHRHWTRPQEVGADRSVRASPGRGGSGDAGLGAKHQRAARPLPMEETTVKLWHLPLRLAAGAIILNSGLNKRGAPPEAAEGLHGMASTAYPVLAEQDPETFTQSLSTGEVALGTALLTPLVPTKLVAAPLTGFAAGLIGLYLRVPGMREPDSIRPTQDGNAIAKDVWLLGIGLAFLADQLTGD